MTKNISRLPVAIANRFDQPAWAGRVPGRGASLYRADRARPDPLGIAEVQGPGIRPHFAR